MPNKLVLPKGTKIPHHIAIIPDGNRRWARARNLNTLEGHKAGFDRAIELARAARSTGVHTVSLWGFSTENWDRTEVEISYLMRLYVRMIDSYIKDARKEKIKLIHIGRKDRLPKFLLKKIAWAEEETKDYTKFIGNFALDYGGHDDIVRATRRMVEDAVPAEEVDKELFEKYLDTHDQLYPYIDLLIRTSGEQRTSGFMMWQAEYAELYWLDRHFPDFTDEMLREAILDYSRRRRRFGGNDKESHFKFSPKVVASLELNWWRLANIPSDASFASYAAQHLREQWGLSKTHALDAAKYLVQASVQGKKNKWASAGRSIREFYEVIKEEVKLAFEPKIAAKLEVKVWQESKKLGKGREGELERSIRKQISEVYRISDFQAAKAAHLRALATNERELATLNSSEAHWAKAEDYLEKYYEALKDRVA